MIDLIAELKSVVVQLTDRSISYALCGGLAMAVHGFPRATVDIDLLVQSDDIPRLDDAMAELGYVLKARPMKFAKIEIHRISKVVDDEVLILDCLIANEELNDVWVSRAEVPWEGTRLSVVSRDGLIQLKALRMSDRDREDIAHLQGQA